MANDKPFPLPVEVAVDGKVRMVEMPGATAALTVPGGRPCRRRSRFADPQYSAAVEAYQGQAHRSDHDRTRPSPAHQPYALGVTGWASSSSWPRAAPPRAAAAGAHRRRRPSAAGDASGSMLGDAAVQSMLGFLAAGLLGPHRA